MGTPTPRPSPGSLETFSYNRPSLLFTQTSFSRAAIGFAHNASATFWHTSRRCITKVVVLSAVRASSVALHDEASVRNAMPRG
jgi:hypothetical protein